MFPLPHAGHRPCWRQAAHHQSDEEGGQGAVRQAAEACAASVPIALDVAQACIWFLLQPPYCLFLPLALALDLALPPVLPLRRHVGGLHLSFPSVCTIPFCLACLRVAACPIPRGVSPRAPLTSAGGPRRRRSGCGLRRGTAGRVRRRAAGPCCGSATAPTSLRTTWRTRHGKSLPGLCSQTCRVLQQPPGPHPTPAAPPPSTPRGTPPHPQSPLHPPINPHAPAPAAGPRLECGLLRRGAHPARRAAAVCGGGGGQRRPHAQPELPALQARWAGASWLRRAGACTLVRHTRCSQPWLIGAHAGRTARIGTGVGGFRGDAERWPGGGCEGYMRRVVQVRRV